MGDKFCQFSFLVTSDEKRAQAPLDLGSGGGAMPMSCISDKWLVAASRRG